MDLKIDDTYPIFVKKWWWKKKVLVESTRVENQTKLYKKSQEFYKNTLHTYGIEVKTIDRFLFFKFNAFPYTENIYINFYFGKSTNNLKIGVMEIADFCISQKYRSIGIGSQLIELLVKIARDNNTSFIVGDLERDREDEPLKDRKRFFIKNGFKVEASLQSKFSGFIVKKRIPSEL